MNSVIDRLLRTATRSPPVSASRLLIDGACPVADQIRLLQPPDYPASQQILDYHGAKNLAAMTKGCEFAVSDALPAALASGAQGTFKRL
jgi:hypothetical protein